MKSKLICVIIFLFSVGILNAQPSFYDTPWVYFLDSSLDTIDFDNDTNYHIQVFNLGHVPTPNCQPLQKAFVLENVPTGHGDKRMYVSAVHNISDAANCSRAMIVNTMSDDTMTIDFIGFKMRARDTIRFRPGYYFFNSIHDHHRIDIYHKTSFNKAERNAFRKLRLINKAANHFKLSSVKHKADIIPFYFYYYKYIIDKHTRDAVPFAIARLFAGDTLLKTTDTDFEGEFVFDLDISGPLPTHIVVSYLGYDSIKISLDQEAIVNSTFEHPFTANFNSDQIIEMTSFSSKGDFYQRKTDSIILDLKVTKMEMFACKKDADCIVVQRYQCKPQTFYTAVAINLEYKDYWNKSVKAPYYEACTPEISPYKIGTSGMYPSCSDDHKCLVKTYEK